MVIRPSRESARGWTHCPKAVRATSHYRLNELGLALNVFWLPECREEGVRCVRMKVRKRQTGLAGGLMPRVVFEKLATLQLLDVRVPTTDGRELLLVRRTEPDRDVALLLARLNLTLPPQPPPRISTPKAN